MRKAFALFDFDGTIIRGDSILYFCIFAYKQGLMSRRQLWQSGWAVLRYFLGLFTAEKSKMVALSFLAGRTEADLSALAQLFFRSVLQPRIRPQAAAELESHRQKGLTILLVTASPSFYLDPLKAEYGIEEVIATRLDIDASGIVTGLICGENCKGIQKPLRLAEYLAAAGDRLDYENSYAYGNSYTDFPMMALCGHKVAVNSTRRLRKKLQKEAGTVFVNWND